MFRGNASALAPDMLPVSYPCDLLLIICFSYLHSTKKPDPQRRFRLFRVWALPCAQSPHHHLAIHRTHALSIGFGSGRRADRFHSSL